MKRPTASLLERRAPLASTREQLRLLAAADVPRADFGAACSSAGRSGLKPAALEIFQINLGRLCNMTCLHCHVDAGPDRTREMMSGRTVDLCLKVLDSTPAHTVDITGGAPELHPEFRRLVDACRERGKRVMDRCNLTVLLTARCEDLPGWLAERQVEVVCSLPHFRRRNTDLQRGTGVFEESIEALRRLNRAGYGKGDPALRLTLVSNPVGAFLAGDQRQLEAEWKAALEDGFGVSFDRLICLNNMPISRFLEWLEASGNLRGYLELLVNAFNPATLDGLMCRNTLSVSWDGRLFDCDFNQMLDLDLRGVDGRSMRLEDFDYKKLGGREVVTGRHCFGCAAGAGSSCGGAIA